MDPVNDTVNAYFSWYKCVEHFNNVPICRSHRNRLIYSDSLCAVF